MISHVLHLLVRKAASRHHKLSTPLCLRQLSKFTRTVLCESVEGGLADCQNMSAVRGLSLIDSNNFQIKHFFLKAQSLCRCNFFCWEKYGKIRGCSDYGGFIMPIIVWAHPLQETWRVLILHSGFVPAFYVYKDCTVWKCRGPPWLVSKHVKSQRCL